MKLHKTQTIVVEEDRAHKYCQAFVNPGSKDRNIPILVEILYKY